MAKETQKRPLEERRQQEGRLVQRHQLQTHCTEDPCAPEQTNVDLVRAGDPRQEE